MPSPVWLACAPVGAVLERAPSPRQWLSPDEMARLAGMFVPHRQSQFMAGRWLLRELLAQAAGGNPRDWPLTAASEVPPTIAREVPGPAWHLALSHSGGRVAAAVSAQAVGIDIEQPRRQRDLDGLAALCCTPAERELLRAGAAGFYELWTVKEAWLKRHADAVAPARLLAVELRPAERDAADAWVWGDEDWTLALSAAAPATLDWQGDTPPWRSAWQVRDAVLKPA